MTWAFKITVLCAQNGPRLRGALVLVRILPDIPSAGVMGRNSLRRYEPAVSQRDQRRVDLFANSMLWGHSLFSVLACSRRGRRTSCL